QPATRRGGRTAKGAGRGAGRPGGTAALRTGRGGAPDRGCREAPRGRRAAGLGWAPRGGWGGGRG
ncbi:unnamed protein product, partial [Bubo scandiacus]